MASLTQIRYAWDNSFCGWDAPLQTGHLPADENGHYSRADMPLLHNLYKTLCQDIFSPLHEQCWPELFVADFPADEHDLNLFYNPLRNCVALDSNLCERVAARHLGPLLAFKIAEAAQHFAQDERSAARRFMEAAGIQENRLKLIDGLFKPEGRWWRLANRMLCNGVERAQNEAGSEIAMEAADTAIGLFGRADTMAAFADAVDAMLNFSFCDSGHPLATYLNQWEKKNGAGNRRFSRELFAEIEGFHATLTPNAALAAEKMPGLSSEAHRQIALLYAEAGLHSQQQSDNKGLLNFERSYFDYFRNKSPEHLLAMRFLAYASRRAIAAEQKEKLTIQELLLPTAEDLDKAVQSMLECNWHASNFYFNQFAQYYSFEDSRQELDDGSLAQIMSSAPGRKRRAPAQAATLTR